MVQLSFLQTPTIMEGCRTWESDDGKFSFIFLPLLTYFCYPELCVSKFNSLCWILDAQNVKLAAGLGVNRTSDVKNNPKI